MGRFTQFGKMRREATKTRVAALAEETGGAVKKDGRGMLVLDIPERGEVHLVQCTQCLQIWVEAEGLECTCGTLAAAPRPKAAVADVKPHSGWQPKTVPVARLDFTRILITGARLGDEHECAGCIGGGAGFFEVTYEQRDGTQASVFLCGDCTARKEQVMKLLASGQRVDRRPPVSSPPACAGRDDTGIGGSQKCTRAPEWMLGIQTLFADGTVGEPVDTPYCTEHRDHYVANAAKPSVRYQIAYVKPLAS
jgi:hypothetical protein